MESYETLLGRIDTLQSVLLNVLHQIKVVHPQSWPQGPELLLAAETFCKYANAELGDEVPLAADVRKIANAKIALKSKAETERQITTFRFRCVQEIKVGMRRGEMQCNFAYYADKVFDVVLDELKEAGYSIMVDAPDYMGHRMIRIRWS